MNFYGFHFCFGGWEVFASNSREGSTEIKSAQPCQMRDEKCVVRCMEDDF